MSQLRFKMETHTSREFGFWRLAIFVPEKRLTSFISALKKLLAPPHEAIVFTQDGFPKIVTVRRNLRPKPKRRIGNYMEETPDGYKVRLFDSALEILLEFHEDWFADGVPYAPGEDIRVKFRGEEVELYFVNDVHIDRKPDRFAVPANEAKKRS